MFSILKPLIRRNELADEPDDVAYSLDRFFVERYMPFAKATKRRSELDEYTYYRHISKTLGTIDLQEITLEHLDSWVLTQIGHGYKPSTVNKHTSLLHRMLNLAETWELLKSNPFKRSMVRHLPIVEQVQRFLTEEEIHKLLGACRSSQHPLLYHFIVLLLLTGARKSELRLAKWSYINRSARTLTVPVSKNGRPRKISLSDEAQEWIDDLKSYIQGLGLKVVRSEYMFTNPRTGKPYQAFHAAFFKAREEAGLPDVRIHDLRHTYASLLINNGASLYEVQKLLGHHHVSMTERYAQLYPNTLHERAGLVSRGLTKALLRPAYRP